MKGKFFLSSYPSEILDEYVKKHKLYTMPIEKSLCAGNGAKITKRSRKIEVLTANYKI